jgi:hypothetical protein
MQLHIQMANRCTIQPSLNWCLQVAWLVDSKVDAEMMQVI